MENIKKCFLKLFLLFASHVSFGQMNINYPFTGYDSFSYPSTNPNSISKPILLSSTIEILANGDTSIVNKFSDSELNTIFKGTPFFNNGNNNLGIIYSEGNIMEGNILYDLQKGDQAQFSNDGFKTLTIVKPDSFVVSGAKFYKLKGAYEDAQNYYYQKIFDDGNNQVYKLNLSEIKFTPKNESVDKNYTGFYEKSAQYFMPNGPYFVKIKPNANFINQLGFYSKDLDWYASAKQLDFKKERDIIEFVKYYSYLNEK